MTADESTCNVQTSGMQLKMSFWLANASSILQNAGEHQDATESRILITGKLVLKIHVQSECEFLVKELITKSPWILMWIPSQPKRLKRCSKKGESKQDLGALKN